jgi:hypothetical protein
MKRLAWRGKRAVDLDEEVMWICLRQRRYDSYGKKLPTYSHEELLAMSDQERQAVKAEGLLPEPADLHAPVRFLKGGGVEWCPCPECEAVRQQWRERTGRV